MKLCSKKRCRASCMLLFSPSLVMEEWAFIARHPWQFVGASGLCAHVAGTAMPSSGVSSDASSATMNGNCTCSPVSDANGTAFSGGT